MSVSLQRKWLVAGVLALFLTVLQGWILWRTRPPMPERPFDVVGAPVAH